MNANQDSNAPDSAPNELELTDFDDLEFTCQKRPKVGGVWVTGTAAGHTFQCLVFPEHATWKEHELDDSRISKLQIVRATPRWQVVADFDRGDWLIKPVDRVAQQVVDFLAAGLAEAVYDRPDSKPQG